VSLDRGERSDQVVLRIYAPEPDVWRAKTYDHWDGESWERSPDGLADISVDEGYVTPGIGDLPENLEFGQFRFYQSVVIEARYAAVLVAAPRPYYVALTRGGRARQGADGSLYPASLLARGDSYGVASDRSRATARDLRALGDIDPGAVPRDVADRYLQLPQVAAAVRALAAEIAAGAPTTYDRVRSVERWIQDNTSVTDDATAVAPGTDPLEAFLLTERSGAPERAATSMAVMLRALGVPSRVAVGFLPGQRAGPNQEFVVRQSDTHAWVEAWFPGAGWQRFDPTGLAPGSDAESVWDRLWRFLKRLWPLLLAVVLVSAAWLARRALRWWRLRSTLPWATRFFARLERAGAARGRPRRPPETPSEYAASLARSVLPDPRLVELGELVTVAAYSRHEPLAEDRARAEAVLREATKAAPVRRGFMAALRRRRRLTR
jgi:transglutaminase-like putative cysteine protease